MFRTPVMIRRLLAASAVAAVAFLPAAESAVASHATTFEKQLRRKINDVRADRGKAKLKMKDILVTKARKQAKTMDDDNQLLNCVPGPAACDHSSQAQLNRYAKAGKCDTGKPPIQEIIGAHVSLDDIVAGWRLSDSHRAIILKKKWERIGTGVHVDGNGNFWAVALFCSTK